MSRKTSIQDIAAAASVSHTTVSRALRDSPLISPEVRERIQKLAQEMGYIPNAVAQSLRGKRTGTIGLVVTSIADPFVGRVVRGVEEVAQRDHLSLFLSVSNNDLQRERAVIETFHHRRVDGIIVVASLMDAGYAERLAGLHVPTVLVNQQSEPRMERLHSVAVDDAGGAQAAVEHLLDLGHRAIGYLGAGNRPHSNRVRYEKYRATLAGAGISVQEEWVRTALPEHRYYSDDVSDGQALLPELLQSGVTAVFCYNDTIASGALLACRAMRFSVPQQVSICGFDDVEMAQLVTPPLTTVHQPKVRLGQVAMEMLLGLLNDSPVQDQVLPTQLVVRASTGPVPMEEPRKLIPPAGSFEAGYLFTPPS